MNTIAIFHLEAKVITRSVGRSAVAASAYMSCSNAYNDYDGIQHDYTRKRGLVWERVFLPTMAPDTWQDREALWNAVEETEKSKDSRLAREFNVALPTELSMQDNVALLKDYLQNYFVAEGMCVDVSIHDGGHNPHAHILFTVRPLNEDGSWQYKTQKEYLCVRGDEERGFTAAEFSTAQEDGWEKQYLYTVGKKKVYMAPSAAEEHGYQRASKYPKSTKFGRQNPITEQWNSESQLVLWRSAWADTVNLHLEKANIPERITHLSFAAQGKTEQPTIHEGVVARMMEQKGFVSDRCEVNRQIREDNRLLHELRKAFDKLANAVQTALSVIAESLEKLRQQLFILRYQQRYIQRGKQEISTTLQAVQPAFKRYATIRQEMKAMSRQRKALLAEKEKTSVLNIPKRAELSRQITTLTEDLEEYKNERNMLMHRFEANSEADMREQGQQAKNMEASLHKLEQSESKFADQQDVALAQYQALEAQANNQDEVAFATERQAIRPAIMQEGIEQLRNVYGKRYDDQIAEQAEKDVGSLLGEKVERRLSIHERLHRVKGDNANRESIEKEKNTYDWMER